MIERKLNMKKEFWIEKWQENQTGFHKSVTHPLLIEYIDRLTLNSGDTVFVPLCGKTLDMLWLNEVGFKVIGVELSQIAVEQFFMENNLSYQVENTELFNVYRYENITIYQGDFFELTAEDLSKVKAVYDRAALIALPDGLIEKYTDKMCQILPSQTKELLITLELQRTTTDALGPPFSIPDEKVHNLFSQYNSITLLQEEDIIDREQGFQKLGCQYVYERVYLITK